MGAFPDLWWTGPVICAVCDHRHVAVVPIDPIDGEPPSGMECPECASMACVVIDEDEDD